MVPMPGAGFGLWMLMTALLQPHDRCLALAPCFGEYRRTQAIYEELTARDRSFDWDLDELETHLGAGAAMCVLANPANPSGRSIEAKYIGKLCRDHPDTMFVIHEAFAAFGPASISLLDRSDVPANVIVVRSLTKELGLPGLRMGYVVANPDVAWRIAGMMPPWPVSAPSLEAAVAGVADLDHIERGARLARAHLQKIDAALRKVGLSPVPSDANYLLVRVQEPRNRSALAG